MVLFFELMLDVFRAGGLKRCRGWCSKDGTRKDLDNSILILRYLACLASSRKFSELALQGWSCVMVLLLG